MKWRRAAAGVTFQLGEINNGGDYRNLSRDAQMRRTPGRVLEGWQHASNNPGCSTAVVKLLFDVLQSRRRLAMWLMLYQHSFVVIVLLIISTPSVHGLTNIGLKKGKTCDWQGTNGGRHWFVNQEREFKILLASNRGGFSADVKMVKTAFFINIDSWRIPMLTDRKMTPNLMEADSWI